MNLSGLTLEIANPAALNPTIIYTLATVSGTRTGTVTMTPLPESRWHLSYQADGSLKLFFVNGTLIKVR